MPDWITPIEPNEIVDGNLYFIALKPVSQHGQWMFYSEPKSGKRQFATKPGIALQYAGSEEFRTYMKENANLCAVEVPKNAGSKWRARK